ncbi:DHCW motif cupin fold protein [Sediminibacterium soli]|uniref:DHCW motif cupin fold protein n=1 Tax=Sediminibacterium soli TaxID=2698829 RepID=UPI00137A74B6|nr:DHCW motif cupin fold protein [Sediminibacterium soli]NCI46480.1 hypothetical protein [Sediminibacterium soli]
MPHYPYQVIDWSTVPFTQHQGETGLAVWHTLQLEGLRIRRVDYSAGYLADHWCRKGHIVHCLEGELETQMENGEIFHLKTGMTYVVSDELSSHRSHTKEGARLLIIDGAFLGI